MFAMFYCLYDVIQVTKFKVVERIGIYHLDRFKNASARHIARGPKGYRIIDQIASPGHGTSLTIIMEKRYETSIYQAPKFIPCVKCAL
jgi:hypothetical protein